MALSNARSASRAVFGLCCLWLATPAGPVMASELDTLRAAWHSAKTSAAYESVAKDLIDYRFRAAYAKTAEIDFMIAISLCEAPGTDDAGRQHFTWILKNYSLGAADYSLIEEQRRDCDGPGEPNKNIQFAMLSAQGGPGAGVRSKLFYWLGREDAAVTTDPVTFVDPKEPEELLARLYDRSSRDAAVNAAKERLGQVKRVVATENFVLASFGKHKEAELDKIGVKLEQFLAFYVEAFKLRPPSHLVTVHLAPDVSALRDLASDLHGLKIPEHSIGYTFRDDLSILGVIPSTAIGTLAHELFHLLVRDLYGDMLPWLDEGTAALFEVSNISAKYLPSGVVDMGVTGAPMVGGELAVQGIPNWRGCILKRIWLDDIQGEGIKRPTIAELVGMSWREFDNLKGDALASRQAVIHATARYFVLYLQDVDRKLFPVFADFASRNPLKITSRNPLKIAEPPEQDAGQRIAAHLGDLVEADRRFDGWLRETLKQQRCQ